MNHSQKTLDSMDEYVQAYLQAKNAYLEANPDTPYPCGCPCDCHCNADDTVKGYLSDDDDDDDDDDEMNEICTMMERFEMNAMNEICTMTQDINLYWV